MAGAEGLLIFTGWTEFDIKGNARDAAGVPLGVGRPQGLHLGQVIHAAKVAAGERVEEVEGDQPLVRMQEGFLWEAAVEYMIAGRGLDEAIDLAFKRYCMQLRSGVVKQVRLVREGIHMTPDAIDSSVPQLESYKATRRTLRKALDAESFAEHFWTWLMQEQGYCLAAGVHSVRWLVLWQAGDYSKGAGSGPRVMEATATFSDDELNANWERVMRIAARLRGV